MIFTIWTEFSITSRHSGETYSSLVLNNNSNISPFGWLFDSSADVYSSIGPKEKSLSGQKNSKSVLSDFLVQSELLFWRLPSV
jgi:hypothetical protein